MTITCWKLSPEEIEEIREQGIIWLSVLGGVHPPVFIGSTTQLRKFMT